MKGVKSEDLVALVDFLYQENIEAFLTIAEELKVKGLTESVDKEKSEEPDPVPTRKRMTFPKQTKTEHFPETDKESSYAI